MLSCRFRWVSVECRMEINTRLTCLRYRYWALHLLQAPPRKFGYFVSGACSGIGALLWCQRVAGHGLTVDGLAISLAVHISGFISIVEGGGSHPARFPHFSVMEFLASYRFTSYGDAPSYPSCMVFARVCLGALLRLDNSTDNNNVVLSPNERGKPLKQSSSRCS